VTRLMLNSCFTLTTRAILLTSETKDGRIALHFAAENAAPNLEFLEFLMSTDAVLTLGAATLHCDVKKDTPLHVLALESGRVDAAEILMKNLSSEQLKTLLTMKNQKGRTVADVAISNGNSKLHEFVQSKLRQLE
jgi:ankyrin repeat protein